MEGRSPRKRMKRREGKLATSRSEWLLSNMRKSHLPPLEFWPPPFPFASGSLVPSGSARESEGRIRLQQAMIFLWELVERR